MTLKHRFLLTSGFTILSVVAVLGGASAASSTRSSAATKHHPAIHVRQPLYNSYHAPIAPVVPAVLRPDCYLPSDGCPNEYSVQN
jgi:hypothetical protein